MTVEERDIASQATEALERVQHVIPLYKQDTRHLPAMPQTAEQRQAALYEADTRELATVSQTAQQKQAHVYELDTTQLATVPKTIRRGGQQPHSKKQRYILALCLLLTVVGILSSALAYPTLMNTFQRYAAWGLGGAQKLQAGITLLETLGQHPFDTQVVTTAQQDFTDALAVFTPLNDGLAFVPDEVRFVPAYGGRLHGAKHLASLAVNAAEAGIAACAIVKALASGLHNPLDTTPGAGLTAANMAVVSQNIQQLKLILDQTIEQVNQLGPQDLQFDPRLGKLLHSFQTRLPLIQQAANAAVALFPNTASTLLGVGKPAYYLLEILDSSELRPGGGFLGNYGILTLSSGRLTPAPTITDSYLLDQAAASTGHSLPPFPEGYNWFPFTKHGWALHDSNLDADFPTSARNAEMLYNQEGGTLPIAGVIAITPTFISSVLTLTGPLVVPEYHETVTAQNFIDRIHYHQLITDSSKPQATSVDGTSQRKRFTALLGKYLLDRVRSLSGSILPKLVQAVIDSIRTKDVQIYFNADPAEKLLHDYHADSSIQSPAGDSVFLVDANTGQNKANRYIATVMTDVVTIDNAGYATHHATIKLNWTSSKLPDAVFYGQKRYRDYLRVYAPPNSALQVYNGWLFQNIGTLFGRRYWGGEMYVAYPNPAGVLLIWKVPHAATQDAQGWHYRYLIQHEAGTQETVDLRAIVPSCATIVAKSANLMTEAKGLVRLLQPITQDTNVSVDYTC